MSPRRRQSTRARRIGLALGVAPALALAVLGLVAHLAALRAALPELPRVVVGGLEREEGCLACHAATQGLGPAHATLGCSPCHEGDPAARDLEPAHRGMVLLVGDLASVGRSCGTAACHPIETARVHTSLMAGAPGILAVNRFAFGERPTPDGDARDRLDALDAGAPPGSRAESHARQLCATCHLAAHKERQGDLGVEGRGGGCTACHLAAPFAGRRDTGGPLHPDVSADVPEKRCLGCHGRSGRIALSYHGVVELEPDDPRVTGALPDGRPIGAAPADVHAASGMRCIDCHTEREVMGDGTPHRHAHEALEIACGDCHLAPPALPPTPDADRAAVAMRLRAAWLRRALPPLSDTPLVTKKGTPLVRTDARARTLRLAADGRELALPPAKSEPYHALPGHERLGCQACHSVWAPRCTSCHTSFDPEGDAVDHLSGATVRGRWLERAGGNGYGPPLLAVGPRGGIEPFVEGMQLVIEDGTSPRIERTLYAPLEPHTTGKARACASCHPAAPAAGAPDADAALDAVYPPRGETTRTEARLLDPKERARIAAVGRCVACHAGYDDAIYRDFAGSRARLARARIGDAGADPAAARCRGAPD
ncbi:MAG: hypothetical protein HY908_17515 [Myxococcales bacterium]|nr:hypothetical protein [Myxococcales bacterium]